MFARGGVCAGLFRLARLAEMRGLMRSRGRSCGRLVLGSWQRFVAIFGNTLRLRAKTCASFGGWTVQRAAGLVPAELRGCQRISYFGRAGPPLCTRHPVIQAVIPTKVGISGEGAGKEPHEIPAFAGMTDEEGMTAWGARWRPRLMVMTSGWPDHGGTPDLHALVPRQ